MAGEIVFYRSDDGKVRVQARLEKELQGEEELLKQLEAATKLIPISKKDTDR